MSKNSQHFNPSKILIGVLLTFAAISALIGWMFKFQWGQSGPFGDTFGAVNALFSALAFAFLIVTLKMQKEELELQREELKLTREEMQEGRKEQSIQTKEMERQNEQLARQNEQMRVSADIQAKAILVPFLREELREIEAEIGRSREDIKRLSDQYGRVIDVPMKKDNIRNAINLENKILDDLYLQKKELSEQLSSLGADLKDFIALKSKSKNLAPPAE